MEFILISWFIFSFVVAFFANSRGRSWVGFFLLSLIASPLLGFIIALVMKDLQAEYERDYRKEREQEARDERDKREHEKQIEALRALRSENVQLINKQGSLSIADELARLSSLLEKGFINQIEFDSLKQDLFKKNN